MEPEITKLLTPSIMQQVAMLAQTETSLIKLTRAFENFVYQYQSGKQQRILRITHSSHRSMAQVVSELHFLQYLCNHNVSAAKVILNAKRELASCIYATDGSYFIVAIFERAEGVGADQFELSPEVLYSWGLTTGKMHRLTKSYQVGTAIEPRYHWYHDPLIENCDRNKGLDDETRQRLNNLIKSIKALPIAQDTYGLIHSDLHQGNFFVNENHITAFDFDDCCYQYFVHDIAIPLYYAFSQGYAGMGKRDFAAYFLKHFMQGYQTENNIAAKWIEQLPLFLELRNFVLYEVLTQKLDAENVSQAYLDMVARLRSIISGKIPYLAFDVTKVWP